jgi:hypothetical protein
MKHKIYLQLLTKVFLTLVLFSTAFAQNQANWNPQKTWIFFVSLVEWQDAESFESFPKENRQDVIFLNVLKQKGVPENQIVSLRDRAATIDKIQKSFETFLSRVPADGSILVYYSGHGYRVDNRETYLASYDAGIKTERSWSVTAIPKMIELYSKSRQAIIIIESCHSGAVVDLIKSRNRSRASYAVFASAPSNASSTGNWTFTESLIYGFRGDPLADRNRDGKITFGEMAQNSYDDLLFADEQLSQSILTGDFSEQSQITTTKKANSPRLGERIEAFDGEDWYRAIITDARGNGEYKVHYYGYEYNEDQFVSADRIRPARKQKQYKIGEEVEAKVDNEWFPARVVEVVGGAHLVSFEDYEEEWNEWVPSDQVRLRKQVKVVSAEH